MSNYVRAIAASLAAVLLVIAGCGDPVPQPPKEKAVAEPEPEAEVPPAPLIDAASLSAIAAGVAKRAAGFRDGAADRRDKVLARVDEGRVVLKAYYADGHLRMYLGDGNLSLDGEAVVAMLAELESHGVDRRPYRLVRVDEATQAVTAAFARERKALLSMSPTPTSARVAAAMARWLRSGKGSELELVKAAGRGLTGLERLGLEQGVDALAEASRATRIAVWAAEAEIARCAVRYLVDFTLAKPIHPHQTTSPATARNLADREADVLLARIKAAGDKLSVAMKGAWPTHPQYAAVRPALARYRAIALAGGWQKLPRMTAKKESKGARGEFVVALRARLAVEGYDVGEGELFDDTLATAVKRFQGRHQLDDDGEVASSTIREFDVPAEARQRQLALALGRIREANARDPEDFFVWINVAAQRVQVYDHGKVVREHRVIVGKDNDDIDFERHVKGRINRTKLFSAKMTKVTLAPRWYPTPRVVDIELGPALSKDPDYFEKHGYVSEMNADGTETVYQKAGKTNLLGVVKFQFPNRHAIYMHDTPSRFLFRKSRRAYSHGCIRLDDPVAMANYLLGRDKGWGKSRIKKVIDEREETVVLLKTAIPVHIDYVTASVDSDGIVEFWGDIYGYDQAAITGQLPVEEVEDFKAASTKGLL